MTTSPPAVHYEQEAGIEVDQVMDQSTNSSLLQRKPMDEEENSLQMKPRYETTDLMIQKQDKADKADEEEAGIEHPPKKMVTKRPSPPTARSAKPLPKT